MCRLQNAHFINFYQNIISTKSSACLSAGALLTSKSILFFSMPSKEKLLPPPIFPLLFFRFCFLATLDNTVTVYYLSLKTFPIRDEFSTAAVEYEGEQETTEALVVAGQNFLGKVDLGDK